MFYKATNCLSVSSFYLFRIGKNVVFVVWILSLLNRASFDCGNLTSLERPSLWPTICCCNSSLLQPNLTNSLFSFSRLAFSIARLLANPWNFHSVQAREYAFIFVTKKCQVKLFKINNAQRNFLLFWYFKICRFFQRKLSKQELNNERGS